MDCEELAELKEEFKSFYHRLHISNAKSACEHKIKDYIRVKFNGDYALNSKDYDNELFSKIYNFYDSCNDKDKKSILKFLQAKKDDLAAELKELKEGKKTLKVCMFGHTDTKADRIQAAEYRLGRAEDLLTKFDEKKNTLRLVGPK